MTERRRWTGMVAGILALTGILAGSAVQRVAAADRQPYKVGVVFSITGTGSFLGEPEKKTVEMLRDEINAKGGINGHPLELVIYDDESDATKCNLAVKKLIKTDKVPVIVGPSRSGESLAVVGVAEESEIPLISCAASYKIVSPIESRKWIFKMPHSDSHVVERIYAHMKAKGIARIGIMTDSTGYGSSGREELLRLAGGYGIAILADERFGDKDTDLSAQLTKIRSTQPQAIVNWSIGPTQVLSVKTWKDLGLTGIPLYQSHGFGSRKNLQLAGDAAEGVLLPLGRLDVGSLLPENNPQKAPIMAYTQAYKARYQEPPSYFGGIAWDALQLAVAALKAVGPEPAKIRDHIEATKGFVGMDGVFNFTAADHCGLSASDLEMIVVKNGDWALAN